MSATLDLIFLCAGRGLRVGLNLPKQFVLLGGKPMLLHSLAVFEQLPMVGRKIIVHDPADATHLTGILDKHGISQWVLVPGGGTRQESVRRGLALVGTERVITHNAAVPFITCGMVADAVATAGDCVTTATEVQDNLVREVGATVRPVVRQGLRVINSPQVFSTAAFRRAHALALVEQRAFNSDSELMLHYGHAVTLIPGPPWSFKVTDRVDLALAETILQRPDLFPGCRADDLAQSHPVEIAPAHR
jgi:2-C-methyl-D-erythritol 4-phosphate cytidylyltransferase